MFHHSFFSRFSFYLHHLDRQKYDTMEEFASDLITKRIAAVRNSPSCEKLKSAVKLLTQATRRHTSICDRFGVRVIDANNIKWFRCVVDQCYAKQTCIKLTTTSTAPATTHLHLIHDIVSERTTTTALNADKLTKLIANSRPEFAMNPQRWFEVSSTAP